MLKTKMLCLAATITFIIGNTAQAAEQIFPNFSEEYVSVISPSKNFSVLNAEMPIQFEKYLLSDSYFENNSNQRWKAAMHVVQQMSPGQRSIFIMFQHSTYLNDIFFPQKSPLNNRNVTSDALNLMPMVEKMRTLRTDPNLLTNITDKESMLKALIAHYDYYINDYFPAKFYAKDGDLFTYEVTNYSGLDIKAVEGNIRIVDRSNGVLLGDTQIALNYRIPSERMKQGLTIRLPSVMPEWNQVEMKDLAFKFQPTAVVTTAGQRIYIHELFLHNTKKFNF